MQRPGLIVAPLTPFTPDLVVDEPALQREIDYVVGDSGATMVVAAGVETQEYTYLSLEQRKDLIRRTIEFVDRRVPVMVGISHPSFKAAIELAHEAERLGAAAVQVLAPLRPFAGPPTRDDLIAYFSAISRETTLPITLYLNPGPGADVSIPDTIALAQLPGVQLIKESSRDLARVSRLIVEIDRAGHARYFTTMQMLLATLELGGSGATMPPPGAEIARHVIDGLPRQGLRARRCRAAAVRSVPRQMDASRPRSGDESGDEPDPRAGRRSVSALRTAQPRRDCGAGGAAAHDRSGGPARRDGRGMRKGEPEACAIRTRL